MLNTIAEKRKYISDVRAERLFREAEDDFFYFDKIAEATLKINKALEFSPEMLKALIMRANIAFIEGNFEQATQFYKKAETVDPNNIKALAGLANVYEVCNRNDESLKYIEKAMSNLKSENSLIKKGLLELKINLLIKLGQYVEAKKILEKSRYSLNEEDFIALCGNNLATINHKLELRQKLKSVKLELVK